MIAFGFPSFPNPLDALKTVGDGIGQVAGAVGDGIGHVASAVGDGLGSAGQWIGDNWKTIAAMGAATIVFVGVVALCVVCPFAVPGVIALAAAGFASGVTFYGVDQLLNGKPLDLKDALVQGGLSAVITVATAGVGRFVAPAIEGVVAPVVSKVLPEAADAFLPAVTKTVTNATVGSVFGGGTKVVENVLQGKPLGDGVGDQAVLGLINGLMVEPANRVVAATGLPVPGAAPVKTEPAPPPVDPEIAQHGVGAKNYGGLPVGFGAVEPLSPIEGVDRVNVDAWNRFTDQFRQKGPLVLTDEQLAKLEPGRIGPSNTLRTGDTTAIANFEQAASKVNQLVASGQDLTIEQIADLNRTLLAGTDKDQYAGLIRSQPGEDVGHGRKGGGFFGYATGTDVPKYLSDFMDWYHANENVLSPTELAGEAYQQLVRIHPFMDSNGRTTRLVMDWILQRNGLPPGVYTTADPNAVHDTSAYVVANTALATTTAQEILTQTTDTTAQPGTTIKVAPAPSPSNASPSNTTGFLGGLGAVDK